MTLDNSLYYALIVYTRATKNACFRYGPLQMTSTLVARDLGHFQTGPTY